MVNLEKVLFLDIDGVICTDIEFNMSTQIFRLQFEWAEQLKVPYPFNQECVKVLNEILTKTDVSIVLSSDWRNHWDIEELDIIFKNNNVIKSPEFCTEKFKRKLSSSLTDDRFHQIMKWVNYNKPKNWVVLDDLDMRMYFEKQKNLDRFFLTNDELGICEPGMKDKIIDFLNNNQE